MHIRVCDVLFPLDTIFIAEKKNDFYDANNAIFR